MVYTPAVYIEATRAVLGTIDLDPASSEIAQTLVQARAFFTAEREGLAQEWHGNVWLNPPYSRDLIGRFVDKLLLEILAGRTQQAILLVHAYTDTGWFRRAAAVNAGPAEIFGVIEDALRIHFAKNQPISCGTIV